MHENAGWLLETIARGFVYRSINVLTRSVSPLELLALTAVAVVAWFAFRRVR